MNSAKIHDELYAVYSQNVMSQVTVKQWSVVSDDLVQSVDQKFVRDSS
jgi:hypothetical protein